MHEGALELGLACGHQPRQQEAVAHAADDAIVRVERSGAGENQSDLALPRERFAAVAADVPRTRAIVNFAKSRQYFGPRFGVHR